MTMMIVYLVLYYFGAIQTYEQTALYFIVWAALKSHMTYNAVRELENKVDELNE